MDLAWWVLSKDSFIHFFESPLLSFSPTRIILLYILLQDIFSLTFAHQLDVSLVKPFANYIPPTHTFVL